MAKNLYDGTKRKIAKTPQTAPIKGKESRMAKNQAGGYSFVLDPWKTLERFLILGTLGSTYYASQKQQTDESLKVLDALIALDGMKVVDMAKEVSVGGLAMRNDPALVAVAVAATSKNADVVNYAMRNLPYVARTGTHLLHFASFIDSRRGWGRSIRNGIQAWFDKLNDNDLAFQMLKYQSRDGWSWADIIKLAHVTPKGKETARNILFRRAMGLEYSGEIPGIGGAWTAMLNAKNENEVAKIVADFGAPMEIVPTEYKNSKVVWQAALPKLGTTAIMRNLGNMTRYGVFEDSKSKYIVLAAFTDADRIKRARVHPFSAFIAERTYEQGHGTRGNAAQNTWTPDRHILSALEDMIYKCFKCQSPTGLKYQLSLDVSGSMSGPSDFMGVDGVSPKVASTVVALGIMNGEPGENVGVYAFDTRYEPVKFSRNMRISDAVRHSAWGGGGTDCSLPFIAAMKEKRFVDVFLTITDNETWAGASHPAQELDRYRQQYNPNAKSVVLGMTSTGFSIADPKDPMSLDIVGMSADVPSVIAKFAGAKEVQQIEDEPEAA